MIARVVAIVVVGMAVNIYIPIAPSILGAWVDYQGFTMEVAGRLTSYDFWGATVASVLAIFLLHRPGWNLRATMLVCLLLVIVTSGASVWFVGNIPALVIVRFINGMGAGMGFTVSCVAVIGTPRIERTYAILYGSPFLISGVGLALLPMVYRAIGIEGAFYGMGVINILSLFLLPYFPRTVQRPEPRSGAASGALDKGARYLAGLALTGLLLHYVFNSGIWAYFERLGVTAGMTPEAAGAILGPSMGAAIVGMFAAGRPMGLYQAYLYRHRRNPGVDAVAARVFLRAGVRPRDRRVQCKHHVRDAVHGRDTRVADSLRSRCNGC
jgi:uncharacterized membrane protein